MSLFTFVHHLDRHTQRRRRSRDSLSVDSGRGDLRSAPLGRLHEAVLSISLDCAAAPRCGCLWALPGCPARPHSRRLWSGRCDLRSGLRSSIPDGQARCCRRVVPHNGSRCRTSSPVLGTNMVPLMAVSIVMIICSSCFQVSFFIAFHFSLFPFHYSLFTRKGPQPFSLNLRHPGLRYHCCRRRCCCRCCRRCYPRVPHSSSCRGSPRTPRPSAG